MKHQIIIKSNQLILLERLYLKGSTIANYYDIGVQGLIKAGIVIPINNNTKDANYLERLVVTKAGKHFLDQIFNHDSNQIRVQSNFKKQHHISIISIIILFYFLIQYFLEKWLNLMNASDYANHFCLAKQSISQELSYLHHFNSNNYNFYNIHLHLTKWGLEVLQSQWFPTVNIILSMVGMVLLIIALLCILTQHQINKNNRLIASQLTKTYLYNNCQNTRGLNWNNDLINIFEYQRSKFTGDTKYYLEMYLY